jgi:hypothetical protein
MAGISGRMLHPFRFLCRIIALPETAPDITPDFCSISLPGFSKEAFNSKEIAKYREIFGKSFMIGFPIVVEKSAKLPRGI